MSLLSESRILKFNSVVGDEFCLRIKAVDERSETENLAVFISQRDDHENLMIEGLFEVVSLKKVS
jgi:hypothetical protein